MTTVISLRKLADVAPALAEAVLVTHRDKVIGEFVPTPRSAQDPAIVPPAVAPPVRAGAPRTRAAAGLRRESAPGGAPTPFSPAPKPGSKR